MVHLQYFSDVSLSLVVFRCRFFCFCSLIRSVFFPHLSIVLTLIQMSVLRRAGYRTLEYLRILVVTEENLELL